MIQDAYEKGAKLIVFPKLMNHAGEATADTFERIPDGETIRIMSAYAKKFNMWINIGTIREITDESDKPYNTTALISPDGQIKATYRKLHLADMQLAKGETPYLESNIVCAGDKIVVADTDIGKIGLSICYDMRFPERN